MQHSILSIQQPWAWAIVNGWKPIENRTWRSNHYGLLLIHAGKRELREDVEDVLEVVSEQAGLEFVELEERYELEKVLGAIVGLCVMRGCTSSQEEAERILRSPAPEAARNVERWWGGAYGFLLTDAEPLAAPVPLRGRLGIWRQEAEV